MTTTTRGSILEHRIGEAGLLAIGLPDGDVRLQAVDGGMLRIRESGEQDLADLFTIELGDGSASLRSSGRTGAVLFGRGNHAADLHIDVPRRATVVIEGASADIHGRELAGDQRYRTASGDVALRGVTGRLNVETVSGDVSISATGDLLLKTQVVSGDVEVRADVVPGLVINSTSGDITVAARFVGAGPFKIETVSGDAVLAPLGDAAIEMTTVSGDLQTEVGTVSGGGRGRRSVLIGRGGPSVTFRSTSGDLHVVSALAAPRGGADTVTAIPAALPAQVKAVPAKGGPADVEPAGSAPGMLVASAVASGSQATDDVTQRFPVSDPASTDDGSLAILQALERGEIDVAEADRRLAALETTDAADA